MYDSVLIETTLTQNYYQDYLKLVNLYQNVRRNSIFARYLNINKEASTYNIETDGTFDRYNSGVVYDVYDYTPLYYSGQLVNEIGDNPDLLGQQIQGFTTATTFTIDKPRIEDLIINIYPPLNGGEIFRVSSYRPVVNAIDSTPSVTWYELTLEYAPIIDIRKLNIANEYVYNLVREKYMYRTNFTKMIQEAAKLNNLFETLKISFNKEVELYKYDSVYPLEPNANIYNFLSDNRFYLEYFNNAFRPFGIKSYGSSGCIDLNYESTTCSTVTGTESSILDYSNDINIYDMSNLVDSWKW